MSTTKQIVYSVILLALAGGAVGWYALSAAPAEGDGMEGHNHAAMGGGEGDEMNPVQLTDRSARAIGVTYATVERTVLDRQVRTVGTVAYDETRRAALNAKVDGWAERLHVDFTGAPVRRGQPLVDLYSPRLVAAQDELILARRLLDRAEEEGATERSRRHAEELLEAARRRLAYWDIPAAEIQRIEESGETRRALTLRAPASGIVVAKNVVEGGRVMSGTDLYEIADLSTVWVEGEVFEKDLALVAEGQAARVTFESYPGEVFEGTITYVYPTVSRDSRTGRVRVELSNPGLRLRPGMYATLRMDIRGSGPVLVVPRTAVLSTGEREIVFVRHDDGTLVPHEVTTGLAAGDRVQVVSGLREGMRVVSSAAFLIDAESNLGAAIGAMPGMPGMGAMDGMDTGSESMEGMDHSGHDMDGMDDMAEDSADHSGHEGMDHSGHE